jgi:predicted nucleic acid-binding protein
VRTTEYVFDAGPLITVCRFTVRGSLVVDHLLAHCQIIVPQAVQREVVTVGERYADAQEAKQRITAGAIKVANPIPAATSLEKALQLYELGEGEYQSILLAYQMGACLVIDDYLGYLVSDRLGIQKRFLLDLLVRLMEEVGLDQNLACEIADTVRPRYTRAMVEHTLLMLGEEDAAG